MLLAHEEVGGSMAETFWTLGDHQNSVHDYVAYDGATVENHVSYNAFGERVGETNPAAVDALFGFTGRPTDDATGLNNHLNRWYDPVLHQWLSEDPKGLGPDENPRRYVGNDPVNFVDPEGLSPPILPNWNPYADLAPKQSFWYWLFPDAKVSVGA
jgi:RHS repeat-associated protein